MSKDTSKLSGNTNLVDQDIKIAAFCKFKKEVIATPGYSKRKTLLEGVLTEFSSQLSKNDSSIISVRFYCNDFVKSVFDKYAVSVAKINDYATVIKSGRAFNGAHRDIGIIVHLVDKKSTDFPSWKKALCGTKPGRRGNGWHDVDRPVNCPTCIQKAISFEKVISKKDEWDEISYPTLNTEENELIRSARRAGFSIFFTNTNEGDRLTIRAAKEFIENLPHL